MFIPIGDDNPTERTPYVNYALIAANVIAFFLLCLGPPDDPRLIRWTMIPKNLEWHTLFTSMFLHAGWFHLIGNMLFLWIFGDNVEDKLGHIGYTVFYFVSGLGADAAHILSNPSSEVPTLGASGAISGVLGAYIVFFPRAHVKMFIWLGILYADVVRTPAFIWIGIWILEQVVLNALSPQGGGGVAYLAHIGGFAVGALIAGVTLVVLRNFASSRKRDDVLDAKHSDRRIFDPVNRDHGIEFLEDSGDGYSVLRLRENPGDVAPISNIVAPITGESPFDVVDRLVVTRGMIARAIPREAAGRIQRDLHTQGIPSAIILHNRSNFPPAPVLAESVTWDARGVRMRAGDQVVPVAWSAPFLYVGARVGGARHIDIFVNRKTVYRIPDSRGLPFREVDSDGRSERMADFASFARAAIDRSRGATVNEGVRAAASGADGDRLDFRTAEHYDDYVFWLYNLTLAQGPRA